MTADEVLAEFKSLGSESYKRMLMRNHGVQEPCFGVKIGDMKKIQKRIKTDHALALELYKTGNYDAMYFAGLIAEDEKMTRKDLQRWVAQASGGALAGSTVPWVAAGGRHGWDVALEWIDSAKAHVASAGWTTLSCLAISKEDSELDIPALRGLLDRVGRSIHEAPDAVRYAMNNFVIAVGTGVKELHPAALRIAEKIGEVKADLGQNSCEIPFAPDRIRLIEKRGEVGKKRKKVKC